MTVVPSPGATSLGVNAPVIMDLLVIGLALPQRVPGGRNRRRSDRTLPGASSLPRPAEQGPWLADWHGRARLARQNTGRRPAHPPDPVPPAAPCWWAG